MTNIRVLDGLRGVAILIVLISHFSNVGLMPLNVMDWKGIGKSGVYLFFSLSSFLLSYQLITYKNRKSVAFYTTYFRRRFLRIYPLYCIFLIVLFLFVTSNQAFGYDLPIIFPVDLTTVLKHILLLDGENITWSIAVEFKFYFLLPVVIALLKFVERNLGSHAAFITLIGLLFIIVLIYPQGEVQGGDISVLPYLPIFIFGTCAAFIQSTLYFNIGEWPKVLTSALLYLSLGLILLMTPKMYSLVVDVVPSNHFHTFFWQQGLLWSTVLLCLINSSGVLVSFLESPLMVGLGKISFSLYLVHMFFLRLALAYHMTGWTGLLFALIGSLVVSTLTYYWIEQTCQKFK